jgi:ribosomal protein S4E
MKRFNIFIVFLLLVFSGQGQEKQEKYKSGSDSSNTFAAFGNKIGEQGAISESEMSKKYELMSVTDTVQAKFRAKVTEVCKVKGCWMKLQLQDGQETMVRFKDYGFFMPLDITGNEVIVNGLAFVENMSVEDQRHFAKDGGSSEQEVAEITQAKRVFGFEADGVLLVKN